MDATSIPMDIHFKSSLLVDALSLRYGFHNSNTSGIYKFEEILSLASQHC